MSNLPASWSNAALLNIAELVRGVTYKKADAASLPFHGSIPVLRANNIQNRTFDLGDLVHVRGELVSQKQRFRPGDVVIATSSGSIAVVGKAAQVRTPLEACFGAFCGLMRPTEQIDARFFGYFFSTDAYRTEVSSMARGVNINNLKRDHFAAISLPLAPFGEQKRIADKLDAVLARVDACRERLDRVPDILRRFRQSVLAAATSGSLTEDWRDQRGYLASCAREEVAARLEARRERDSAAGGRFREPSSPDLTYWSTVIPHTWSVESVSAYAEGLDHMRVPVKKEKRVNTHSLYPYYGANGQVDQVDGYLFDGELVLVTEDETFYGREKPIAYRTSGKCWVNNHAHVLSAGDRIRANYLCFCLMYYNVLPWLTGTTGRAKLTQGVLNSIPIAVPTTEEMVEIVRCVETLFAYADRLEARYTYARAQVERLTPALLAKAFRGELVPQDPNDEPASVLLERIRAARAAAPAKPKRGRGAALLESREDSVEAVVAAHRS